MYLDDPNVVMNNTLMENMYFNHPIRYDIGGTLDSIMDITSETLNHVYDSFYHPSNRLVVIAGKVDLKAIQAYFQAYDLKYPLKHEKPKTIYPRELKRIRVKQVLETKRHWVFQRLCSVSSLFLRNLSQKNKSSAKWLLL